ncbi:MAG: carbohydrate ABC transporter permease [Anaerolineae bacterium]|nr:carbohydrate ABC transporter permease [Anaerolineae bacterium]
MGSFPRSAGARPLHQAPGRARWLTLGKRSQKRFADATTYVLLLGMGLVSILPLLWMLSTSLKRSNELYVFPPQFIPAEPTLANYLELARFGILTSLRNSAIVATSVTLIVVFTSALAGYAFAKLSLPAGELLFILVLSGLMVPWEVIVIPLFIFVARLGWSNTFHGIILPMCASPFGVFVMRQFMLSMPSELLDAARIDGASEYGIFSRIVLPLTKPALAALSTLVFLGAWNNFLWPLLTTSRTDMRVLPVAIALFKQEFTASYGPMMAAATVGFLPMLILYLAFQRYFVQGITLSGLKG